MRRKRVDLGRLPRAVRYLVALILCVSVFGWLYLQKTKGPMPDWIKFYLFERPGVTGLALVVLFAAIGLLRRMMR